MPDKSTMKQEIINLTDQCVMCGLCLPHCPTYSVAKNEAESPRGRISLVRALHEGKLQPSSTLVHHLDNCLACMNCHTVCPAKVDYQKILDAGREITRDQHTLSYRLTQSLLLFILTKVNTRTLVKKMLSIYHRLGMDHPLKRLSTKFPYGLRLLKLIPKPQSLSMPPPAQTGEKVRVALAIPCASDLFSDITKNAAKYLLQALHCEILEQKSTHCCGALHQHSGYLKTAKTLMQSFCRAYSDEHFDVLVSTATGCGAQLNRYSELLGDTRATNLIDKHVDINDFILRQIRQHKPQFRPLPKEVFIHKPCTQKLVTDEPKVIEQLLSAIPEIQLRVFQNESLCCGAGGINSLTQAKLADNLINSKIAELKCSDAEYLVTSNIGCALHFQAQLQDNNISIRVCHPITLLAQQLLYS